MRGLVRLLTVVLFLVLGTINHVMLPHVAAQEASPAAGTPCPATTEEENESLVRRYYEEVWNQGHIDVFDEVWGPAAIIDPPVSPQLNRDELRARILEFRGAFPDLRADVQFVLTEEDAVVVGVVRTGTHRGAFDGIPPTGLTAEWSALEMLRIECGQLVAYWIEANGLDLRRDLGIITEEELASIATPVATPAP
jgi:steroid delta-isomerase-like uncharacterized protein